MALEKQRSPEEGSGRGCPGLLVMVVLVCRLLGSYAAVRAGQLSDAYMALTGGLSEKLEVEEEGEDKAVQLFTRLQAALASRAIVVAIVPVRCAIHVVLLSFCYC